MKIMSVISKMFSFILNRRPVPPTVPTPEGPQYPARAQMPNAYNKTANLSAYTAAVGATFIKG